jgi:hypothetical protein
VSGGNPRPGKTYTGPYCVIGVIVAKRVVEVERLCALCDKVLCLIVYIRYHGPLSVESPCNELYVCGKDRVDRRRAIVGRSKILVELTGAGLVLCIAAHEGLVGHGEGEERRGDCRAQQPSSTSTSMSGRVPVSLDVVATG